MAPARMNAVVYWQSIFPPVASRSPQVVPESRHFLIDREADLPLESVDTHDQQPPAATEWVRRALSWMPGRKRTEWFSLLPPPCPRASAPA
jgi:hypothetical protein